MSSLDIGQNLIFNTNSFMYNYNFQNVCTSPGFYDFSFLLKNFNFKPMFFMPQLYFPPINYSFNNVLINSLKTTPEEKTPKLTPPKISYNKNLINNNLKINNKYISLSKDEAEKQAEKDSNLERLTGGKSWSVSAKSFKTDIPFAKKGTSAILEKVSNIIGEEIVITSALGTGHPNNPHKKKGYDSHHNADNPKLDIRICGNPKDFAAKLDATGYFSHILIEKDHLDVQIDPSKFTNFEGIG